MWLLVTPTRTTLLLSVCAVAFHLITTSSHVRCYALLCLLIAYHCYQNTSCLQINLVPFEALRAWGNYVGVRIWACIPLASCFLYCQRCVALHTLFLRPGELLCNHKQMLFCCCDSHLRQGLALSLSDLVLGVEHQCLFSACVSWRLLCFLLLCVPVCFWLDMHTDQYSRSCCFLCQSAGQA